MNKKLSAVTLLTASALALGACASGSTTSPSASGSAAASAAPRTSPCGSPGGTRPTNCATT
jgi:hypothetical protein